MRQPNVEEIDDNGGNVPLDEDDELIDLAEVVAPLRSDAPLSQRLVSLGITQALMDRDFAQETMRTMNPTRVTLSTLQQTYETGTPARIPRSSAIRLLEKPQQVTIDQRYTRRYNDPSLAFSSIKSHVDALMIVPSDIGLDAVLPVERPSQSFNLQLCLHNPSRPFTAKNGYFGFETTRSLMWIGKYPCDALWCGLAHEIPGAAPLHTQPVRGRPKDATADNDVIFMIFMFFAYSLSVAGVADIHISGDRYPLDISTIQGVKNNTNIMYALITTHPCISPMSRDPAYRRIEHSIPIQSFHFADGLDRFLSAVRHPTRSLHMY